MQNIQGLYPRRGQGQGRAVDYEVTILEPALEDLESQVRFKAEVSEESALDHADRIFTAADSLRLHPHRGKLIPWLEGNYRGLVLRPDYHLVYKVDDQALTVKIFAILHSSQSFKQAWLSRKRP